MSRWQTRAACRTAPPELFYPEDHIANAGTKEWREECDAVVNRYCLRCPVRLDCLAFVVEGEGTVSRGVWGGINFLDRKPWNDGDVPLRCECGNVIDPMPRLRLGEDTRRCHECS